MPSAKTSAMAKMMMLLVVAMSLILPVQTCCPANPGQHPTVFRQHT